MEKFIYFWSGRLNVVRRVLHPKQTNQVNAIPTGCSIDTNKLILKCM